MDVQNSSQYHLYLLTLHFLGIEKSLIPKNSNERWAYGTIINRAYYSSYLFCELWLEKVHNFKSTHPKDFPKGKKKHGKHKQVRDALNRFGEKTIKNKLAKLAKLRNDADYKPYKKIKKKDVQKAIGYMEYIMNNLKFD